MKTTLFVKGNFKILIKLEREDKIVLHVRYANLLSCQFYSRRPSVTDLVLLISLTTLFPFCDYSSLVARRWRQSDGNVGIVEWAGDGRVGVGCGGYYRESEVWRLWTTVVIETAPIHYHVIDSAAFFSSPETKQPLDKYTKWNFHTDLSCYRKNNIKPE